MYEHCCVVAALRDSKQAYKLSSFRLHINSTLFDRISHVNQNVRTGNEDLALSETQT